MMERLPLGGLSLLEPHLKGSDEAMLELPLGDRFDAERSGIIQVAVAFPVGQLVGEIEGGGFRNRQAESDGAFLDAAVRLAET